MRPAPPTYVWADESVTGPLHVAAADVLLLMSPPVFETPVPATASDSPATVWPLRSSAPPAETVVPASVEPSAVALPSFSVPAVTFVLPVNELAPARVTVPAPDLMTAPPPETTPPTV